MSQIFIPEKVVLYIEKDGQMGVIHNLEKDKKAYINVDMINIIQHLTRENTLDSFFPTIMPKDEREHITQQTLSLIDQLKKAGLLIDKKPVCSGLIKKINTNPPLRVVFIQLTKFCNLKCKHCYAANKIRENSVKEKEMELINFYNLISQIDDMGVMEVQITGGEPFLSPHILEVVQTIQRRLIPCSIFTNGTLITENIFKYISLNNSGLIFYISLDGYQQTHDAFRRCNGSFQTTTTTIKKLLQIGCDVRINTAVGKHNIVEMPKFIKFIKKEFGVLHRLITIEPLGRANQNMSVSVEEFSKLLRDNCDEIEFLDSHDSVVDYSTPACGIGSSMLFIDSCGNVSLCPILTQRENPRFLAGNIIHSSLKNIWEESSIFKTIRNTQCREISNCNFRKLCKGGCRSRAYLSTGDLNSPDFEMCSLYNN